MTAEDRICLFKWLVVSFLILYMTVSVGIAIFMLYLRFEFFSSSFMTTDPGLDKYYVAISILIAGSVLGFVAGIFGLFGAFFRKIVLLAICLTMVILFLSVQVAGACYGYYYRFTFQSDFENGIYLKKMVQNDYGVNEAKTEAMDYMQWKLKCCGGDSFTDYQDSLWYSTHQQHEKMYVTPPTCCKNYERHRESRLYYCPMYDSTEGALHVKRANKEMHQMGCGEAVLQYIKLHYIPLISLATSFVIYQKVVVGLLSMLIHVLRMRNVEDDGFEMSRSFENSAWKGGTPYW